MHVSTVKRVKFVGDRMPSTGVKRRLRSCDIFLNVHTQIRIKVVTRNAPFKRS
jgi:hypothetical protein